MSRFDLLTEKEMELAEFVFATITWLQGSWRLHCNRIGTGAYKSNEFRRAKRIQFIQSLKALRNSIDDLIREMDPLKEASDPEALKVRRNRSE